MTEIFNRYDAAQHARTSKIIQGVEGENYGDHVVIVGEGLDLDGLQEVLSFMQLRFIKQERRIRFLEKRLNCHLEGPED